MSLGTELVREIALSWDINNSEDGMKSNQVGEGAKVGHLGCYVGIVCDFVAPMYTWTGVSKVVIDKHVIQQRCVSLPLIPF